MGKQTESDRLAAEKNRAEDWKRWGPYLSERQWATVREDYSDSGNCWDYFPHDHARSRAYRWGEDGLLGFTDRKCRLCFALALWNEKDPILKERIFGLTASEGNHGEDVKDEYFYLAATPTYSYAKALYKYPQAEFPYRWLVEENRRRGKFDREFELVDTGVFKENRYFDVFAEYAKDSPDDILIRITVANRGPEEATLHLLPTLWFRNEWSWGTIDEAPRTRPAITLSGEGRLAATHETLGRFSLEYGPDPEGKMPTPLFTENNTNKRRLWNIDNESTYVKDAFHAYVVSGQKDAVNPANTGTKAALHYILRVPAGQSVCMALRLHGKDDASAQPLGPSFGRIFADRLAEFEQYVRNLSVAKLNDDELNILQQVAAGLLWSKQFYHYVVDEWLKGDPIGPPPPDSRRWGRNKEWRHLHSRDVISMPDKWEYPWFASWDLAFHVVPLARDIVKSCGSIRVDIKRRPPLLRR